MGFVIYTYPKGDFDAIELSIRKAGFVVERSIGSGDKARVVIEEGFARAEIVDFTESQAETRFVILNGRKSLFTALGMWPIDIWLGRKLERHVIENGACILDFRKEEANR